MAIPYNIHAGSPLTHWHLTNNVPLSISNNDTEQICHIRLIKSIRDRTYNLFLHINSLHFIYIEEFLHLLHLYEVNNTDKQTLIDILYTARPHGKPLHINSPKPAIIINVHVVTKITECMSSQIMIKCHSMSKRFVFKCPSFNYNI